VRRPGATWTVRRNLAGAVGPEARLKQALDRSNDAARARPELQDLRGWQLGRDVVDLDDGKRVRVIELLAAREALAGCWSATAR